MKNKYKAFTLIEVTLSIILIGALIAITTPLVSSITIRNDLSSAHESLYNALLRAQNLSKTNYKNAQWRVCINNTSKTYIITAGTCASNLYPETIKIGSEVEVSSTQTLDIPFKIGGELDYNNNFIRVTLSGGGVSKSILITKDGVIDKVSTTDPAIATIVTNGLVLHLDAGNTASYPGNGTTWNDLSGNGNNFTLNNPLAFNNSGPKYMDFNGSFGASFRSTNITLSNTVTYMIWTRVKSSTGDWRTLTRAEGGSYNHHVIFESGSNRLGMYNNSGQNSPGAFVDSGFSQTSLPNYGTSNWVCLYWRFNTFSPYYQFSYNDTPGTIRGSSTQTGSQYWTTGFGSLGAYNATSGSPAQFWGDIAAFYVYNRVLSDNELLQNFNATKSRFGL